MQLNLGFFPVKHHIFNPEDPKHERVVGEHVDNINNKLMRLQMECSYSHPWKYMSRLVFFANTYT